MWLPLLIYRCRLSGGGWPAARNFNFPTRGRHRHYPPTKAGLSPDACRLVTARLAPEVFAALLALSSKRVQMSTSTGFHGQITQHLDYRLFEICKGQFERVY